MTVVTLTTDMGLKDYYVAAVKGALLLGADNLTIIDVSHEIVPFDIGHASFVLRNCYREFPEGTLHLIGVNPEETEKSKHVVVHHNGHFFIGADNGIFSMLFDELPETIYEITFLGPLAGQSFPTKNVFVPTALALIRGEPLANIGLPKESLLRKQLFRPVMDDFSVKGTVSYIDAYGNIMTNITRALFDEVGKGRTFKIHLTRAGYSISKIHERYGEVPEGEKVAVFSSSGFLEIAINKGVERSGGGANKLFGLKLNDTITIEFE
jgi:S-adenosyl-L-methionine hydrolase (adenosine-forming)